MPPKKPTTVSKAAAKAKTPSAPTGKTVAKGKTAATTTKGAQQTGQKKSSDGKGKQQGKKEKVWTKEDEAACKIQKEIRVFLGKKALEKKRKEKEDYEELMLKLEKDAFVQMVKMQQEEVDRQMKKEDEERKRSKEEAKRKKRMLEMAYDGDNDSILAILQEVRDIDNKNNIGNDVIGKAVRNKHILAMIECEDANENTPLSEAASGGHVDTIKLLLSYNADPNTKGQFQRTPLYRAAFAGHLEPCQILLENGADPRLYASDGQTPEQIASNPAIQEMLNLWDITRTESLLKQIESAKDQRLEEDKKRREAEQNKLEGVVEEVLKEYESRQKQLRQAHCELNKRITEHDEAIASGFDRPELTIQTINDAELELEIVKLETEKARDKLAQARLRLREQQNGDDGGEVVDNLPGVKVAIRELEEVLLRDVGNKIRDSGKWPLIIDTSGQASTFLRYRDTNCINALRQQDMEPNRIRIALLGAIRYGKPLILDMMQVDMFEVCTERFNEIQKGLMDSLLDSSILTDDKFLSLVKETDGVEYSATKHFFVENFKFFIVTANPYPSEELMTKMYPIRIILPS